MDGLQKTAVIAGFILALAAGFWAGQDFAKFTAQWDRCVAYGGDGLTVGEKQCFKRQAVAVPNS